MFATYRKLIAALKASEASAAARSCDVRFRKNWSSRLSTRAFCESASLCQIVVSSETKFAPSAMEGSENAIIICKAGSAAQAFVKTNDIPYLLIP